MDLSNVNFISAESLIAEVNLQLRNYFESGLVTEAVIPTYIDNAIRKLGTLALQSDTYVIYINDYVGTLPRDFHKMIYAYTYDYTYEYQGSLPTTTGWYVRNTETDGNCSTTSDIYERIEITSQAYKVQLKNPILLKVVHSHDYCTIDSPNYKANCHDEMVISSNRVTTSFPSGYVYLKYYRKPVDEDNIPMIPDIIQVEEYIKAWVKFQLMEQIFNGSSLETFNQTREKFQFYRQDAQQKFQGALSTLKMQDKGQVKKGLSRQKKSNLKFIITA